MLTQNYIIKYVMHFSFGFDRKTQLMLETFVFAGDETALSVSGKQYQTSDRVIALDDIITIDLSPQWCDTWGDYARTIILKLGV